MVENRYEPPRKLALSDEDLLEALGSDRPDASGTLNAIAVLERETELRNRDRAEFDYWVAQMVAENSVESRLALERFAPEKVAELPSVSEPVAAIVTSPEPLVAAPFTPEPSLEKPFEPSASELQALDAFLADSIKIDEPEPPVSPQNKVSVASTVKSARAGSRRLYDFITSNDRAKPTSQFWAWFGISGTALPVLISALFARLGFSFGQSAAAIALGFIGSAVIISVGSLAGKRSGLPTTVISRAAFGVVANMFPAIALLASRIFWVVAAALAGAAFIGGVSPSTPEASATLVDLGGWSIPWAVVFVAALLLLAGTAIVFGGRVLASVQKIGGLLGVGTSIALLIAEWPRLASAQLSFAEGVSNLEVITAAIIIVAGMGLAWVSAGADFARKLPTNALGVKVVGWALLGLAVVPTLVGIAGAAAFSGLQLDQSENPLAQALTVLPNWAPPLLVPGMTLTIVVWIAMALYSANLGFQALGIKFGARVGAAICLLLALVLAGFGYNLWAVTGLWNNLAGLAVFFGVPVAAWSGIFIGDVLLRRIAYHEVSLSRSYGFYGAFNWINLIGWLVAVAIGSSMVVVKAFGLTLTGLLIIEPAGSIPANLGLFVAGFVGLLFPLIIGVRRIKAQEREVLAIEARRKDLADIFDGNRELGFE